MIRSEEENMLEQLLELLKIGGAVLLFTVIWFVSIAIVFRDINRRRLNGLEQFLWLAAVALLPIIGFIIYWVARLLTRLLMPENAARAAMREDPRLRMTAVKPRVEQPPLYQQQGRQPTPPAGQPGAYRSTNPPLQPNPQQGQQGYAAPAASSQWGQAPGQRPATSGPRQAFALVALEGPYLGSKFVLSQLPVRIGRGSSVMIQLDADQGISRQHAEIYPDVNGGLRIRDLNSTHGTLVNGMRTGDTILTPGDRITMGLSTFLFSENRG